VAIERNVGDIRIGDLPLPWLVREGMGSLHSASMA
jgi:hypothetical protein